MSISLTIKLSDKQFEKLSKAMLIRNPDEPLPDIYWFYGDCLKDFGLEKVEEIIRDET